MCGLVCVCVCVCVCVGGGGGWLTHAGYSKIAHIPYLAMRHPGMRHYFCKTDLVQGLEWNIRNGILTSDLTTASTGVPVTHSVRLSQSPLFSFLGGVERAVQRFFFTTLKNSFSFHSFNNSLA